MQIKLWGVRGSLPAPMVNTEYRAKLQEILKRALKEGLSAASEIKPFIDALPIQLQNVHGGNTTCAAVTSAAGNLYILDCGTGIRGLGEELLKGSAGKGGVTMRIFITHTHWDHIQGFPFFKPAYVPGNVIQFYSPLSDLQDRFRYQQEARFFPAPLEAMASTKEFHLIKPGTALRFDDGMEIDCYPLKHPGGSFAYRFRENGSTFVFATDAEFTGDYLETVEAQTGFFDGADLVVLDSQYTLDESFSKFDWGHTSYTMAVNCGIRWKVKNLVLTHHEPAYQDAKLARIYRDAVGHRNLMKSKLPNIYLATEQMSFQVGSAPK
ncbi:MAG: MBL fold metallo-hydrolase [Spirochaetes bacterium]|nr:MAG: MBL fold metallo-hydrolase [Spirochaetota bacterium]